MIYFPKKCPVYDAGKLYEAITGQKHPKQVRSDHLNDAWYNNYLTTTIMRVKNSIEDEEYDEPEENNEKEVEESEEITLDK